jgi:hypothetical protein
MIMVLVAFACFLVLVIAWLMASNVEGTPEKAAESAPRPVETQATVEMA